MTPQERLELYKQGLKDWSKPYSDGSFMSDDTGAGFCWYYDQKHKISFECNFEELEEQRKIPWNGDGADWHYSGRGWETEGRSQRVKALKEAIKLVKQKI